jgi:hypothetical protein
LAIWRPIQRDPQYRHVGPGPCLSIAVVVRCRRLYFVGRAILVLDHRRPSPQKILVEIQTRA